MGDQVFVQKKHEKNLGKHKGNIWRKLWTQIRTTWELNEKIMIKDRTYHHVGLAILNYTQRFGEQIHKVHFFPNAERKVPV